MKTIIFIHNIEGGPSVNVFLNKKQVLSNFNFQDITPIKFNCDKEKSKIVVTTTNGTTILKQKVVATVSGNSFIITGLAADLTTIFGMYTKNDCQCPDYGKSKFRFIHAAAGVANVDVFSGSDRIYHNVGYGGSTEGGVERYLDATCGTLNISVTLNNTLSVIVGPLTLFMAAGSVCSIILSGSMSLDGSSLQVIVSTELESDQCDKLKNDFKISKYMGKWYQIASIPQPFAVGCERQSAEYSLNGESVKVLNTCYTIDSGNKWIIEKTITGSAVVLNPEYPASLYVSFPNIPPYPGPNIANYLIHYTDYEYAIVGSPDRTNLYILYRKKEMKKDLYQELLQKAKKLGYNIKLVVKD